MRKVLIWSLAVLAVLAGGWAAGWFWFAGTLRERVEGWAEARRGEGLTVAYGPLTVAGFPWRWTVRIEQPRLVGAGAAGWRWDGETVEADLRPWAMRDVTLRWPGEQRFTAGGGRVQETWIAHAARPDGRATIDDRGRLERVAFDFGDATLARSGDAQPMRAERLAGQAVVRRG